MTEVRKLTEEIAEARREISSDGYPMSVGELTNLYRDGELIIRPEYQRFFRWSASQKSRLVESLLLGIPLPSIFVAQTERGVWEIVDGLQRISTILELQGELRGVDGQLLPPLELQATKYLPSLEGKRWAGETFEGSLGDAERLDIKRSKIDVKIIKRESSPKAKFDLFQRLNSYGTLLNAQEMRSAIVVGASPNFFAWLERLSSYEPFVASTQLSDRLVDERYDLELVTRFLVLHNWPVNKITQKAFRDLPVLLDNESVRLATEFPEGNLDLEGVFKRTFDFIADNGGEDVFRRWDKARGEFRGSFLNTAFEVFALGIGYRIANNLPCRTDLIQSAKTFWALPKMQSKFATGKSTEARLVDFMPLGRELTEVQPKSYF